MNKKRFLILRKSRYGKIKENEKQKNGTHFKYFGGLKTL